MGFAGKFIPSETHIETSQLFPRAPFVVSRDSNIAVLPCCFS